MVRFDLPPGLLTSIKAVVQKITFRYQFISAFIQNLILYLLGYMGISEEKLREFEVRNLVLRNVNRLLLRAKSNLRGLCFYLIHLINYPLLVDADRILSKIKAGTLSEGVDIDLLTKTITKKIGVTIEQMRSETIVTQQPSEWQARMSTLQARQCASGPVDRERIKTCTRGLPLSAGMHDHKTLASLATGHTLEHSTLNFLKGKPIFATGEQEFGGADLSEEDFFNNRFEIIIPEFSSDEICNKFLEEFKNLKIDSMRRLLKALKRFSKLLTISFTKDLYFSVMMLRTLEDWIGVQFGMVEIEFQINIIRLVAGNLEDNKVLVHLLFMQHFSKEQKENSFLQLFINTLTNDIDRRRSIVFSPTKGV